MVHIDAWYIHMDKVKTSLVSIYICRKEPKKVIKYLKYLSFLGKHGHKINVHFPVVV